ncbi:MAG: UvrD-helicase domain-containing protein [Candidatus Margulisiibacteriota bacterium]
MAILKSLNDKQKEAVLCTDGPVLIIAGAGSGKTRVLTHRIAYLIKEKNVPPHEILAVTFTNKAADELKHRLKKLVGIPAREMWVGTFHSICGRILRQHIEKLGWDRNYVIYDSDDQKALIKEVLKQLDYDDKKYKPAAVLDSISKAKNELIGVEEYESKAADFWQEKITPCYRLYQEKLRKNNAIDFDDMLMLAVELLQKYSSVREHYQERFRYVNIDEYQDTNHAQYMIAHMLSGKYGNICVVGDDDQSIYGFRGADIRNILEFESNYPDAKVFKLEENYRSTKNILVAANNVISNNAGRKEKELWTKSHCGEKIISYLASDERDEARFIIGEIKKMSLKRPLGDMVILYRTNAQSRVIEEVLLQNGLPYKIFGGFRFYERKEIKDLLSLLKVIFNPADKLSFFRVIGFMTEGIGKTTLKKIEVEAEKNSGSILDVLKDLGQLQLTQKTKQSIYCLVEKVEKIKSEVEKLPASKIVELAIEASGLVKSFEAEGTEESLSRSENIKEFLSVAIDFEKNSDDVSLGAFLMQISLVTDQDTADLSKPFVTLMTLHSAKGLEFPVVFMAGMEEGIFPHYRSMFEPKELEEERRLCYVGITRAKEKLYITHAQERMLFGESWCNGPSRFLEEIPENIIKKTSAEDGADRKYEKITVSSEIESIYNVGDIISHPKWGSGEIVRIEQAGEDTVVDIMFSPMVTKSLMLKYAPIQKR